MRFRPVPRMLICQAAALLAFLAFLGIMRSNVPARPDSQSTSPTSQDAKIFVSLAGEEEPTATQETSAKEPKTDATAPAHEPRKPERFRPSATSAEESSTVADLPKALPRAKGTEKRVVVPPRDLPLSYLMKFKNMDEFHAFLDTLPDEHDTDHPTMSLIRIEGLPETLPRMQQLFRSYRMEPFLFNPKRFNYLIASDLKLLRDPDAIRDHIARLGRYLQGDGENAAYRELTRQFVSQALAKEEITSAITDRSEFERMQLGLASPQLAKLFRKLETDTANQLSGLLGQTIAVRDISRIDCQFRDVNGAVVLVPWQAYLGSDPQHSPIRIWEDG